MNSLANLTVAFLFVSVVEFSINAMVNIYISSVPSDHYTYLDIFDIVVAEGALCKLEPAMFIVDWSKAFLVLCPLHH